jgi:uncharacterized membrane protein YfhO
VNPTWLYVAAVYAAAIWLARRAGIADLRWRVAAFFYLLVLIFIWRPMTGAFVNIPVDFIQTLPPWAYMHAPLKPGNSDLNDIVLQIVPWAHQVRESWRSFDAPLWNHLSGSGYPLLGNGQSSALSPLRLLALPLNLGHAMTAEAAWKILIALTFTFLYCRRRGYSELAGAAGAVSFGFATFIITWLHFPLVTVACFVPAVLYSLDLLVERRTYGRFVFGAALWAVMLYGGHPETVSHTFFIALLSLMWILAVERPFPAWRDALRFVLTLGCVLTVAALLAAPFLIPFLEGLKKSKRFHELEANPNVVGYYSDWPSAIVLLQPHFFGAVPHEAAWGPAVAESITGFVGMLGVGAWFAVLAHVIRRRAWRSREFFFVIAALLVLGIILAWPGISDAFHLLFQLAANARLRLLLCLLLAFLTAALVDLLQRERAALWLIAPLVASAILLYLMQSTDFPSDAARDTAMLALIPSVLTLFAAAMVPLLPPRWRDAGVMVVLALGINELWSVGRDWNPTVADRLMYPKTPLIEALDKLKNEQREPFRIVGTGPVFFANAPAVFGFEDIRAHDPMANGRYLGILRVLAGYETSDYFAKWTNFETRILDYLNVRYVVAPPASNLPLPERWELKYDGRDGRIFENRDVLPRFFTVDNVILEFNKDEFARRLQILNEWGNTALLDRLKVENEQMKRDFLEPRPPNSPQANLTITSAAPTDYHLRVRAPRYSLAVSSIPWWPGWKATRNGKRIEPIRVNGGFTGFAVPPGESEVRVWYAPWSWWGGVWVGVGTALGLIVMSKKRISNFE